MSALKIDTQFTADRGPAMNKRTLPTHEGWWLVNVTYLPDAVPAKVFEGLELCRLFGEQDLLDTEDVRLYWLAPIPGPSMCAALARYSETVLGEQGSGPDWIDHLIGEACALDHAIRTAAAEKVS